MDKQSKKELLAVVERQGDQLKRYEARLRDVVQAYKGLQKEKTALEKSLSVLSTSGKVDLAESHQCQGECNNEENENISSSKAETTGESMQIALNEEIKPEQVEEIGVVCNDQVPLQAQVETLRETLKTIMEQKTKMESSFQADKKKYLHELEKKEEDFQREREEFSELKETMLKDIQELKIRTCGEQQARETELNDYATTLKEMQVIVAKERLAREELQNKVEHLEKSLSEKEAQCAPTEANKSDSESKVSSATDSNKATSQGESVQDSDDSQIFLKLQQEMTKMKLQLENDILAEQRRANEAEKKASLVATAEEQRVADLEAKLSELSNVVGKYERLRSHDQMEIQKLKDRLHILNTTTNETVVADIRNLENDLNVNTGNLADVFAKLKEILRFHFQNQEDLESNDIGVSRAELECILKNDPAHKACQEELRQLKDEFECYKAKAQAMRKTRLESVTESNSKDTEKLKNQIKSFQAAVQSLQKELEDKDNQLVILQEKSACDKIDLQKLHNSILDSERTIYAAKMQELESQVRNQRSRTLSLINEKDCEIERLKNKVATESSNPPFTRSTNGLPRKNSISDNAVNELLSQKSPQLPLVHYAQEQAYCEAEFVLLKKHRRELEESIREFSLREEQAAEQIQVLKEEIRKLERNCSRENANLEYLKNVIVRYLLADSESVRQQMVAAISTILEFSPQELSCVKRRIKGWWGR